MRHAITVGLVVALHAPPASAEGEFGPMFGGSVVAGRAADETETAGVELEVSVWRGPIGLALAGSRQAVLDQDGPRVTAVDVSLRVLALRALIPSLLDARDVELGIELHGIVERAWWDGDDRGRRSLGYGLGFAVRLRGGSDDDQSNLLAESRLFARAMTSRNDDEDELALRMSGGPDTARDREVTFVVGLGAVFGGGQPGYVQRFRRRPLDASMLVPN